MSESSSRSPGEIVTGTAGRACEACHKKKTRCDMQQPVCGLCSRTKRDCHFPSTRKRPGRQEHSIRSKAHKTNDSPDYPTGPGQMDPSPINGSLTSGTSDREISPDRHTSLTMTSATSTLSDSALFATLNRTPNAIINGSGPTSNSLPIPSELALHLIDIFFDRINPWIGIFHKPTFVTWSNRILSKFEDANTLRVDELMLFNSMFALAARFSNHASLGTGHPRDRGEQFIKHAERWFAVLRDHTDVNLTSLRACILLASYHYTAGSLTRGWLILHICIRGCYELGLHQLDDDDAEPHDASSWVDQELLRRVFWAIWEIDTFGSIVKRKPFAIDQRHIQVKLPVADEAWFAGHMIDSAKFIPGPECWKALVGCPNQDERAWMLLAKSFCGYTFDITLSKEIINQDQRSILENNISCFKLAMPESFHLSSSPAFDGRMSPAHKGCVIAANLFLSVCNYQLMNLMANENTHGSVEENEAMQLEVYNARLAELSAIMRKWPPECIPYSHPSVACSLLSYEDSLVKKMPPSVLTSSYRDLATLILAKFAEKWNLGAVLLRVLDITNDFRTGDSKVRAELVKQYPVYFDRTTRNKQKHILGDVHKARNRKAGNPDFSPTQLSHSLDQTSLQNHVAQQKNIDSAMGLVGNETPNSINTQDMGLLSNFSPFPENMDSIISEFLNEPDWLESDQFNFDV